MSAVVRGAITHLHRSEVVYRALDMIIAVPTPPKGAPKDAGNRPIHYRNDDSGLLGGRDPYAVHCADWSYGNRTPTSDCIGFALWASGIDRYQPDYKGTRGHWLNCASLMADAKGAQRFCRLLKKGEQVKPADWLLTTGHIGVIIRPETRTSKHLVVDCSPRHGRETAINTGGPWSTSCVVVRPLFYMDS